MDNQWTWKTPTEPGWYWFCGSLWGHRVDMEPVKVRSVSTGLMFSAMNSFLYPHDGDCNGVWQAMDVPTMPMPEMRRH